MTKKAAQSLVGLFKRKVWKVWIYSES